MTTATDELVRISKQWRHAELHGWHETAEAHRRRLDLLLDDLPQQRDTTERL